MRAEDILYFWFTEAGPEAWWQKSKDFDDLVRRRFLGVYQKASKGELWTWRDTPRGRLAEIIVLDQFPRNMFRDTARSFESDILALGLSQEAVRIRADEHMTVNEKAFLYMPHMHSESLSVHDQALKLFAAPGLEANHEFEIKHRVIIEQFGRYPHRNAILGRQSTEAEAEFLKGPDSSF